jgi:diguanylate cyclase (GGDEF)-like protein
MMLIDLAKFDELSAQDCVPPCCDESEAMRRKVAQIGLDLDEPGRRLIEDLLEAAANAEQRIAEQRARIRYLENLSITDELTGVLNRRGFKLELERALARAERRGETGVLLLGDLNRFKAINDSLGHLAGDSVLRAVAHELRRSTRRSDYVARIGGDEFAVLMTDAHREEAKVRSSRLANQVNGLKVPWREGSIPVSAAFGLEAYDASSDLEDLIGTADRALYTAKEPCLLKAV